MNNEVGVSKFNLCRIFASEIWYFFNLPCFLLVWLWCITIFIRLQPSVNTYNFVTDSSSIKFVMLLISVPRQSTDTEFWHKQSIGQENGCLSCFVTADSAGSIPTKPFSNKAWVSFWSGHHTWDSASANLHVVVDKIIRREEKNTIGLIVFNLFQIILQEFNTIVHIPWLDYISSRCTNT